MTLKAALSKLVQRKTFQSVHHVPKDQQVIPSNLFEVEKFDASGEYIKLKARLVAGGNRVDRSMYGSADETSAPTARFESVMLVLAAASFHNPILSGLISTLTILISLATYQSECYVNFPEGGGKPFVGCKKNHIYFLPVNNI
jgi:hypothetical protein